MHITGIKTPIFNVNDSLIEFIIKNIPILDEGDILVITSKIVALSEGRIAPTEDKDKIIRKESIKVIETPWGILTLNKDGWGINAGVDESNAKDSLILLPKDSFKSAESILQKLKKKYKLKKLGVLITDTRSLPLRAGTIGRALGFAGFRPLKSYIGKKDLYGRKSRVTQSNHADALAASAVLSMGEGNEQTPMAHIKNAPVTFTSKPLSNKERHLAFPPEMDIFAKIFTSQKSDKTNEQKSRKTHKK